MNIPLSTRTRSESTTPRSWKPSQQTYVHNRAIIQQKRRKAPKTGAESAQVRLETKKHLIGLAGELGAKEKGNIRRRALDLESELRRCHQYITFLACDQGHKGNILPNFTCGFRLCPNCSRRRANRIRNKYLPSLTAYARAARVQAVHLVLTQSHRVETRKQSTKRLKASFTKLQRREFWKEYFKGGVFAVEFTKGADGLHHTHLHIIAFRSKFFDVEALRDEWRAVTGDSHVLRVDRINDIEKGLQEVVKYISKPLDIARFDANDLAEFIGFKHMRFFGTFGEYKKFHRAFVPSDDEGADLSQVVSFTDLIEGSACPCCERDGLNNPLFELRLSEDELPDFLRNLEASARSKSPPGNS